MKKRNNFEEIDAQYGKLPPQAVDVEEAIIGSMILESDCFINNPVSGNWFYKEEHQKIIGCVEKLSRENKPIDLLTVTIALKDSELLDEIGGPGYITQLVTQVSSSAHIKHHVRIIQQKYAQRELIRISNEVQNMAYDDSIDIDDTFGFVQSQFSKVMSFGDDSSCTLGQASESLIDRLTSNKEMGTKTGLSKYDKFTGGFHNSDLTIIAGETSQGKTSLALTMFKNCVINGSKAAIFSLEMTRDQLLSRIISQRTGVRAKKIMYNKLNEKEKKIVIADIEAIKHLPIYFDESTSNDIDKICAAIRKLKLKKDINLVLVDYIQDMKGANDESGIADIARKLKNIAKELNISIIAVSQLSRDKNNPEPTRSRLRGSGQLEEKADNVLLIYRPEVYGRQYSDPYTNIPVANTALIKIAKGRNIGVGSFIVGFDKETTNFFDYIP